MINLLCSGLLMIALLSGCGWDGTPTRHNDLSPPTSLEIVADSATIAVNTSTKLTVKGNYSGQYTLDITDQAVWTSETPGVASFSSAASPNQVFARAPGVAILTATVRGVSASFLLTVSQATITSLTVTPAAPSIASGLNTQFSVVGTFIDATTSNVTTQNLTDDVVWASSSPGVASVSDVAGSKGRAQGLAVGTATISATFGGVSGTSLLTVTAPVAQSLAIAPSTVNLTVGESKNLIATASFSDGTTQNVTDSTAWTSSATSIATVGDSAADKGKVTAVANGSATITAVYGGLPAATAAVTVADKVLESLALNAVTHTFSSFSEVADFTATANYTDKTSEDVTGKAEWKVDNSGIAALVPGNPGQVKPVTSGTTILRATYRGITQTATLIVP